MIRFASLLRWSVIGLISSALVLGVVVLTIVYRPALLVGTAQGLVHAATGRQLEIGQVVLSPGSVTTLTVLNLSLSNVAWRDADFVSASEITVKLDIPALFGGVIDIVDVHTAGLAIDIAERDGKPASFALTVNESTSDAASADRWAINVRRVTAADARVVIDVSDSEPITLSIAALEVDAAPDDMLAFTGSGDVNQLSWTTDGAFGPFSALLETGLVMVKLRLATDLSLVDLREIRVDLQTMNPERVDARIRIPDIAELRSVVALPETVTGDVDLDVLAVSGVAGHALTLSGNVASSVVKVDGELVGELVAPDSLRADVSIAGADAGKLWAIAGLPRLHESGFSVNGAVELHSGQLEVSDVRVDFDDIDARFDLLLPAFPAIDDAKGNLQLAVTDLSRYLPLLGLPASHLPLQLTAHLDDADLNGRLALGDENHVLDFSAVAGELPDFRGSSAEVSLVGSSARHLLNLVGVSDSAIPDLRYQLGGHLLYGVEDLEGREVSLQMGSVDLRTRLATDFSAVTLDGELDVASLKSLAQELSLGQPLPDSAAKGNFTLNYQPDSLALAFDTVEIAQVTASGTVQLDPRQPQRIEVELTAQGSALQQLLERSLPIAGDRAFVFDSRLVKDGEAIDIARLKLDVEGNTLELEGRTSTSGTDTELNVTARGDDLSLLSAGYGIYRTPQHPFQVSARVAIPDNKGLSISDINAVLGSTSVSGQVDINLEKLEQASAQLLVSGGSMVDLGSFNERQLPDQPFEMTLSAEGDGEQLIIDSVVAKWASSELRVNGTVSMDEVPDIQLHLRSPYMEMASIQSVFMGDDATDTLDDAPAKERLIPDTAIPVAQLRRLNLVLDAEVSHYIGRLNDLQNVKADLTLSEGTLTVNRFAYDNEYGGISASGQIAAAADDSSVALSAELLAENYSLNLVPSASENLSSPRFNMRASVEGAGGTPAELAGSLNGRVLVATPGGSIDNRGLNLLAGDFAMNVITQLNPFVESSNTTSIQCLVVSTTLVDGVVHVKPGLAMRTDKMKMSVVGTVDLSTEKIDVSMATQPRKGLGISVSSIVNPYFKVGGTLLDPQLQLDAASAAVASGIITATGGMSIVAEGLWQRIRRKRDACQLLLNQWDAELANAVAEDAPVR